MCESWKLGAGVAAKPMPTNGHRVASENSRIHDSKDGGITAKPMNAHGHRDRSRRTANPQQFQEQYARASVGNVGFCQSLKGPEYVPVVSPSEITDRSARVRARDGMQNLGRNHVALGVLSFSGMRSVEIYAD